MKNSNLYVSLAWLMMLVSIVMSFLITNDSQLENHALFSTATFIAYFICIISWHKLGGRLLSLYVFFVVYAFFCNAGQSLLYSLGVHDTIMYTYEHEWIGDITKMLRFQFLCVSALNLGACLYMSRHRIVSISELREHYNNNQREYNPHDGLLDVLMFISLAYVAVMCVNMFIMRQTMDYGDFFQAGRGESIDYLSGFFDFFSIILPVRCLFRKRHVQFVYISYLFFIWIFMLVGSRGLAIRYLALTMICLPMTHPRLFAKRYIAFWIVGFVVGFAGLSVISASRSSALSSATFDLSNSLLTGVFNTIDEMGNSARPAVLSMTVADGALGHKQTFLYTVVCGIIPFTSDLSYFQDQYLYVGDYLTSVVGSYSGLGSSYIGECYINYGWLGWLFMLLYGYLVAWGENTAFKKVLKGDYLFALFMFAILSRQVAFGRTEFLRLAPLFRTIEVVFIFSMFFRLNKLAR